MILICNRKLIGFPNALLFPLFKQNHAIFLGYLCAFIGKQTWAAGGNDAGCNDDANCCLYVSTISVTHGISPRHEKYPPDHEPLL
jgi:hypothetical protein